MLNKKFVKKIKESALVVTNILVDTAGKLNVIYKNADMVISSIHDFLNENIEVLLLKNCASQYEFIKSKINDIVLTIEADNIDAKTQISVSHFIPLEGDIAIVVNSYGNVDVKDKTETVAKATKSEEPLMTDWLKRFLKNDWFDMTFPPINMLGLPDGCGEYELKYKTNDDGTFTCTSKVNGKEVTKTYKLQEV